MSKAIAAMLSCRRYGKSLCEAQGGRYRQTAALVGGDAAALLLFAAIGRGSHSELNGMAGIFTTAWPFLAGTLPPPPPPPFPLRPHMHTYTFTKPEQSAQSRALVNTGTKARTSASTSRGPYT